MIRAIFFVIFTAIFPLTSNACSCSSPGIVIDFQTADFVAKAKLIKITPDSADSEYHDADLEIISLYKGERLSRIKIASSLNTSCAFLPKENTTWYIFAKRWNGILSFHYCTGSFERKDVFDNVKYPNTEIRFNRYERKEEAMSFLSENSRSNNLPNYCHVFREDMPTFKGLQNKSSFAAFELELNSDRSIAGIRVLRKFQNKKLNKLFFKDLKTKLKFSCRHLTKPVKVVILCFYTPEHDGHKSFLSFDI